LLRVIGFTPTGIGLVVAAGSAAAMAGAALTRRLARWAGSTRVVWLSLAATAPLAALTAFARPGVLVVLVVVGTVAGEFGQIVYAITSVSVRQQICPDSMLGRVNATMRVLIMAAFSVGAVLGGLVAELAGLRAALLLAAGIVLASPWPVRRALRGATTVEELIGTPDQ
jgi:predicted MFS family arabinose efflux permease